jgi:hypothetical protein
VLLQWRSKATNAANKWSGRGGPHLAIGQISLSRLPRSRAWQQSATRTAPVGPARSARWYGPDAPAGSHAVFCKHAAARRSTGQRQRPTDRAPLVTALRLLGCAFVDNRLGLACDSTRRAASAESGCRGRDHTREGPRWKRPRHYPHAFDGDHRLRRDRRVGSVQLRTGWLVDAEDAERLEVGLGTDHGALAVTVFVASALDLARAIAAAYDFDAVPPAVIALALIADARSAAAHAFPAAPTLGRDELLQLIAEEVVGTRLVGLECLISEVRDSRDLCYDSRM